ncbi:rhomboid-domain-containing protein, partial [Martensiomyces pterosporus]
EVSPEATVYAIIGLNGVVFLLWKSGQERMNSFHDSKMMAWMMRNFTAMWVNLKEGRIWTLVTPAFSHIEPMHLLINMFVLYSFGTDIARLIGPKRFLAFYLGAAACGNMISAYLRGVVMPRRTGNYSTAVQPAVGASTSVVGITTLFACLYPHATFQLFFFVPVPAWLATAGFIGWDVWRVMRSDRTKVDGAGHLGGAAAGLGYY